jgi:integrase
MPKSVTSHIGFTVDLSSKKRWRTFANREKRGSVTFPVEYILKPHVLDQRFGEDGRMLRRRSKFGDTFIHVIMLYCVEIVATRMPMGSRNVMLGFVHFEKYLAAVYEWGAREYRFYSGHINREILDSYARWIVDNCPANDKYVGYVRDLYAFGVERGFPGFDRKKLIELKTVKTRSKFARNIAMFQDALLGAFDFEEERQILHAFEVGLGSAEDRATAGIFHQTGIRNSAAVRLKYRHLEKAPAGDKYILHVPCTKKRHATNTTRPHVLENWLGKLLGDLRPAKASGEAFLLHWARDAEAAHDVRRCLKRWAMEAELKTIRTDDSEPQPLNITPYRFRRTLASNLAARGASQWTIANVLDDETLSMAAVYANNASTIVEILAETLDRHPAWFRLLHLFLGRLESSDDERLPMIVGAVPYLSNYFEFADKVGEIGRCARGGRCVLLPPLSCYQCPFFRASLDVRSHQQQLEQLKGEINMGIGIESDGVTAAIVDDIAAILAAIAAIGEAVGSSGGKTRAIAGAMKTIASTKTRRRRLDGETLPT